MKTILLTLLSIIGITLTAQNLQVGLVAHYPLDNNGNDLSTTSNHLIIDSNATFSPFFGNNMALEFNGTDRADQTTIFNNSNFTSTAVALWFRADSLVPIGFLTPDQIFIQGAYAGFGLGIKNGTGNLLAFFSYSSANGVVSDSNYFDGNWHHIVAQNNGVTTKLYIDGQLMKTHTETLSTGNSPLLKKIYLGASNLNTRSFIGGLNDVRVYNRILTQAEISILSTFPISTSITNTKNKEVEISIYPNPTKDNISIVSNKSLLGSTFVIRNMLGQNVAEGFLQTEKQDISISGEKGIYFVEIITADNEKIVSKVIKN